MTFSDQSAMSAHNDKAHAPSKTKPSTKTSTRPPRPEHPYAKHQCDICGRKFTTVSSLNLHQRTVHHHYNTARVLRSPSAISAPRPLRPEHPNAKHPCVVCGRKFTRACDMRVHLKTVHVVGDVKTFQCDVCFKNFNRKGTLKTHLSIVHRIGDVKIFQCEVCSKMFKQKSILQTHLSSVHGVGDVKTFKCDVCSKVFKHKGHLKTHLATVHGH